jgi:MFS family permease
VSEVRAHKTPSASLWRNRAFNIYWGGQTLSALGDAFAFVAVPLLVLEATGSVSQMGLVTATFGVGQIFSGVWAGAIVDRVDRRRLMIGCDLLRAALYGVIPLYWVLVGPDLWLIYAVTALSAVFGNLFSVAYITATTNLVDKEQITEANGRLFGSTGLTFVVGPMLAGLITGRYGAIAAIGINAASFIISAISLSMIRLRQERATRTEHTDLADELSAGVRYLFGQPVLRWVAILFISVTMMTTGVVDLLIFEVKRELHQDDTTVGLVMGASAVGAVIGGVLAGRIRARLGFGACFLGSMVIQAASMVAIGLLPTLSSVAICGALWNAAMTVRGVSTMSLRQQITPDALLGRVTAAFWTLSAVLGPIGAAGATRLAESAGPMPVTVWIGIALLATAIAGLFTPTRAARPEEWAASSSTDRRAA